MGRQMVPDIFVKNKSIRTVFVQPWEDRGRSVPGGFRDQRETNPGPAGGGENKVSRGRRSHFTCLASSERNHRKKKKKKVR